MKRKPFNLRKHVVAELVHMMATAGYGIYHELWKLTHNPQYRDCWTPQERELMIRKIEEFEKFLRFLGKMSRRLRGL